MSTTQQVLDSADATRVAPVEAIGSVRLQEVDRLIQSLVASWQGNGALFERRRWHRVRFERPLGVTPLDQDDPQPVAAMRVVRGKDVSLSGISFTHTEPLPQRLVAVTFWDEHGSMESVVTQLTWCRFTRDGVYQSGGQFLKRIVLSESAAEDENPLVGAE